MVEFRGVLTDITALKFSFSKLEEDKAQNFNYQGGPRKF